MKRQFTDEQIIGVLKEQESGEPVAKIDRRHGIGQSTLYKWKAKYGGMEVNDAPHLNALEDENIRLKRLLADSLLDNQILRNVNSKKWSRSTPAGQQSVIYATTSNFAFMRSPIC